MADILPFKRPPKKKARNTLCKNGHHKWKVDTNWKFDKEPQSSSNGLPVAPGIVLYAARGAGNGRSPCQSAQQSRARFLA